MKPLRIIDLFAGIGGIRSGFENVFKSKFVFSSEIDKYAKKTYFANYQQMPHGDITKINEKDIPKHDILLAGFPCQAFSNAGLKKGFEDTRGTLFFEVARIIKYHMPKIVFLENVKGLLSHDKGNTFAVITKTLEDLGYKIFKKVLNSKNYDLPQNRERIFLVCFLDQDINFNFPEPSMKKTRLGNILDKNVDNKYTLSDRLWEGHKRRKEDHKRNGNGFGYSLFNEDSEYTSTLSARYYKDGTEILIAQENKNPRRLTPREACRLQGFPEDFKFEVSETQLYKQFGNSVSVSVIEAIAKQIKIAINGKSKK